VNWFILHPFLVPLFPVIAIYLNNLTSLPPATLVRPVIVLELVSLLSWAGLTRLFRNTRAAAVMVSVLMFIFFLNKDGGTLTMLTVWLLAAIVLTQQGRKNPARLAKVSGPLNVVVLTLLLLQTGRYIHSVRRAALETEQAAIVTVPTPDPKSLPNIVHIILDGFGRPDLIKQKTGSDVQFLVEYLKTNGFFVADQARANYMQTMQSLGTELSMNYLPGSTRSAPNGPSLSRTQLSRVVANSPVQRELVQMGYRVEGSVITSFTLDRWSNSGTNKALLSTAEDILIHNSCLQPLVELVQSFRDLQSIVGDPALQAHYARVKNQFALQAHYARVRNEFETGADQVRQRGPVYQILHILSPHPPFIFNADGSYRDPTHGHAGGIVMFGDATHFARSDNNWSNYKEGYGEQVRWIAEETCRLVQRILHESTRPVVIIIQGDHGPGLRYDWTTPDACDFNGRSGILMAIRLPNRTPDLAPEYQSPVNIYRYLFRELWGANLPFLPTHVFYSTWSRPDVFEDVTARIEDQPH
jgi:hypothetical protein